MTAKDIFKSKLNKSEIIIYEGKPPLTEDDIFDYVITSKKNESAENVIDLHEVWIDDNGIGIYSEPISLPFESIEKLYQETVIKFIVF